MPEVFPAIGERMKLLERITSRQTTVMTRMFIIRLDGKAFHSYTKGMQKPQDSRLAQSMRETALYLCQEVQGVVMGYTQSDEISLLVDMTDSPDSQTWFGGNIQKIASVSASLCTAYFNRCMMTQELALFDSRVMALDNDTDLRNYFVWRYRDNSRNAVSSLARCYFSHKRLQNKSAAEMREMIATSGQAQLCEYSGHFQHGLFVYPLVIVEPVTWQHKITGEWHTEPAVERRSWTTTNLTRLSDLDRDSAWWGVLNQRLRCEEPSSTSV